MAGSEIIDSLDPLADVIHRAMDRVGVRCCDQRAGVRCYDLAHAIYRDGWRQEQVKKETT